MVASPSSRAIIARRTSELSVRTEALGLPAFACEMGAGFPPFFPPIEERDSAFIALAALAYGLRGFNVYMAVERDRWIGAPIDPHGRARPFATFWRKLAAALDRTSFFTLTRPTPVRILTPRSERRLARVMHAFGPITGAFFSIAGKGARESVSEQDLGLGYPLGIESDSFARTFEAALDARGVPFACIGGEDRDVSLDGARWILVRHLRRPQPRALPPPRRRLRPPARASRSVRASPRSTAPTARSPSRSTSPASLPPAPRPSPSWSGTTPPRPTTPSRARSPILGLPTWACDPDGIFATVHEDATGRARVVFLLNPGDGDVLAHVHLGAEVARAVDVLDEAVFTLDRGGLEVRMMPRTVRMLALE